MLRVISVITYTYTIFVSIHTYSHFQLTLSKLSQNYRVRFNVHLWRKKLPSLISFLKILSVAFSVDDPRVGLQCELAKPSFFSIRKWVFRLRSLSFFFFWMEMWCGCFWMIMWLCFLFFLKVWALRYLLLDEMFGFSKRRMKLGR